jgi:hypothetical protein
VVFRGSDDASTTGSAVKDEFEPAKKYSSGGLYVELRIMLIRRT